MVNRDPELLEGSSPPARQLHLALLAAGIPVVVCRPHVHRSCQEDCRQELSPPVGWSRVTVEQAANDIVRFRPGVDTLAMIGGHGIDVLDIDLKAGGDLDEVPRELRQWGYTRTPSGGWHVPVPSTGYGKGDLFIRGAYQGDYVGGTAAGGSRLLCFLPGSTRPKYPNAGYVEVVPWDVAALVAAEPLAELLQLCEQSHLSMHGTASKPPATPAQVDAFKALHSGDVYRLGAANCGYGHVALTRILDDAALVNPGDKHSGRHMWAIRAVMRVTELMAAGCLTSQALDMVGGHFALMKSGSAAELDSIMKHAVSNASAKTKCEVHCGA